VQIIPIDKSTNLLADDTCTDDYSAAFLDGTEPTETCDHKGGMGGDDHRNILQKIFGIGKPAN
jgi:penicillin-binding protein 1B